MELSVLSNVKEHHFFQYQLSRIVCVTSDDRRKHLLGFQFCYFKKMLICQKYHFNV